jgi:hypothetical protein
MKKWTKEEIKENLLKSDEWVVKALVRLHGLQTADERATRTASQTNGVGFNKFDADFMSSLAESYQQWERLTPRQMHFARKKIVKYAGQLAKLANA